MRMEFRGKKTVKSKRGEPFLVLTCEHAKRGVCLRYAGPQLRNPPFKTPTCNFIPCDNVSIILLCTQPGLIVSLLLLLIVPKTPYGPLIYPINEKSAPPLTILPAQSTCKFFDQQFKLVSKTNLYAKPMV